MIKEAVLIVSAVVYSTQVQASNWVTFISNGADPTVLIDQQSISKKGKYVKAWFMVTYSSPHTDTPPSPYAFKAYTSMKALRYFDCVEKTGATIQSVFYNNNDYVGGYEGDISKIIFAEPIPDTEGEAEMNYLCNLTKKAR